MNKLFLFAGLRNESVMLKIGSRRSGRRVVLTADEAVKLGYKLMSLGKGGATQGLEQFPPEQD